MNRSKFLLFFLPFFLSAELTTSVIVPCYYQHAKHLEELLNELAGQTVAPDEVVISISEADKLDRPLTEELEYKRWPFTLIIKRTNEQKWAGENRNIAAENSSGDILICQDADDLPHPQRVEIIKHLFTKYRIDYLMHYFIMPHPKHLKEPYLRKFQMHHFDLQTMLLKKLKTHLRGFPTDPAFENIVQRVPNLSIKRTNVHFGNCALRKTLFNSVKWTHKPRGQDVHFYNDVHNFTPNTYLVNLPLVIYQQSQSSKQYLKRAKRL